MTKPFLIVAMCIGLGACGDVAGTGGASGADGPAERAVDPYLGKRLVGDNATFIFNADGSFGGDFRGAPITGVWTSTGSEICSTITAPETIAGQRCSTPARSGNTVVFNRRDGSNSGQYRIEG